jgi:AmiR/NasT family two-component response regulator
MPTETRTSSIWPIDWEKTLESRTNEADAEAEWAASGTSSVLVVGNISPASLYPSVSLAMEAYNRGKQLSRLRPDYCRELDRIKSVQTH